LIKIIFLSHFYLGRDTNVLICVKRRLAMCARKLGKLKEAVKMFRDVIDPSSSQSLSKLFIVIFITPFFASTAH